MTTALSVPSGCGRQACGASRIKGTNRSANRGRMPPALRATLHSASIWLSRISCITEVMQFQRVRRQDEIGGEGYNLDSRWAAGRGTAGSVRARDARTSRIFGNAVAPAPLAHRPLFGDWPDFPDRAVAGDHRTAFAGARAAAR